MKFGIITPVYDKCFESVKLLYEDLKQQTYQNWTWLICSNGYSKLFADFAKSNNKDDPGKRIVYLCTNYVELKNNCFSTIANIGKRRKVCLEKIDSDYVLFFDADAKILDRKMFETLNSALSAKPASLCLYYIKHISTNMPTFPIIDGRIDLLNFCVRSDIARSVGYPNRVDYYIPANDYKSFVRYYRASGGDAIFLNRLFCEYNGNNRYRNARRLVVNMQAKKGSTTKQYLFYSLRQYPMGLFRAAKDFPFAKNLLSYNAVFRRHIYYKTTRINRGFTQQAPDFLALKVQG